MDNLWARLQESAQALANIDIIKVDDIKPVEKETNA